MHYSLQNHYTLAQLCKLYLQTSTLVSKQEEAASESFASEGISGGSSASGISLDEDSKSKQGDRATQTFLEFGETNTVLYLRNVKLVENMPASDPLSSKKQT